MAARSIPTSNKNKKIGGWFVGLVLGASLLLTFNNIQTAFKSYSDRQLISPSENFASSKYQPILFGDRQKISQYDFSKVDRLAKQLNYSGTSVIELANLLGQNAQTESEKARIIYAWITQQITYDVAAFLDAINNDNYPDVTIETVLRDRTTICSGYSNLYHALAEAMNLESAIVIGYAKSATPAAEKFQDVNHAWNSVRIDGAWYLLDATWGAGSVRDNKFVPDYKPYYFATAPEEFINNHYPQDKGWQLLNKTYARAEFDSLPSISSRFYNLGLKLVSHKNDRVSTSNQLNIELKIPQNVVATAELKQNGQTLLNNSILTNRNGDRLIVSVAPPEAGTYELTIYAKKKEALKEYGEIINYQIDASNSTAQLAKTSGHFHQHQASLIEPLGADLKSDWSTYFNLVVPEAEDVQIINTTTQQWTPLTGYGSYFAGHVELQPGTIAVVAKFAEGDRYWQLVEYQAK